MSETLTPQTPAAAVPPTTEPSATRRRRRREPEPGRLVASQWQLVRWKFAKHRVAMVSLGILVCFYLVSIFAEFTAPYDPSRNDKDLIFAPPTPIRFIDADGRFHLRPFVYEMTGVIDRSTLLRVYTVDTSIRHPIYLFVRGDEYKLLGLWRGDLHLFGTREAGRLSVFGADRLGRDMMSRVIYGGRISLSIGLVGIAISFVLGIVIGGVSGYFGGTTDLIIQRIIEFIRSIPTLPLWMGLSVALPPQWSMIKIYFGIVVILSLVGWTGLARVVRGKFMALREEDFVMAARAHGASEGRLIFRHLLPSFSSHIIASLTLSVPGMILGETSLSFIGLGLRAPAISWGVLLNEAQAIRVLANSPWLLMPGVFVVIAILAFNFMGDGLRDAADPYSTA